MDATVNDFLSEINEIAPLARKKQMCAWQECYDENSGFAYYWNTETDEVTWEMPKEYKQFKESVKNISTNDKRTMFLPPKTKSAPLFPSTSVPGNDCVKIYKIGDNVSSQKTGNPTKQVASTNKPKTTKRYPHSSDSEDEKIVLISSYGGDSESEDESTPVTKSAGSQVQSPKIELKEVTPEILKSQKDDSDDDLLSEIQKKANELKALGGELPPGVKKIVSPQPLKAKPVSQKPAEKNQKKAVEGFSLVAGYSDSEDEETEDQEIKSIFPLGLKTAHTPEPKVSHSTLFPITKPIDVKEFIEPPKEKEKIETAKSVPTEFDSKLFQRKRRIGVDLVNSRKKPVENNEESSERKGFGFNSNANPSTSTYPGFKSGGVMFVKSDVLNDPNNSVKSADSCGEDRLKTTEEDGSLGVKKQDVESNYQVIKEKLGFLSEGREPVSPVQAMIIQIETLFTAVKDGGLKLSYLHKWLTDTSAELIKLEKESAPDGWLLQWDRSQKRYYYQNQTTGEGQWEYPQPDIVRCDEAMDISTTPPPNPEEQPIHMSPPLPPKIRSPSPPPPPPPPPIISREETSLNFKDVPLPPATSYAKQDVNSNGEPLPPGVDVSESLPYSQSNEVSVTAQVPPAADLSIALDSFYSDIAAIESTNSPTSPLVEEDKTENSQDGVSEPAAKKKKKKVKLVQGLSMKKKGVSKLVEKWKSVSYTD